MRYIEKDGTPVTVYQPNERRGGLIWALLSPLLRVISFYFCFSSVF